MNIVEGTEMLLSSSTGGGGGVGAIATFTTTTTTIQPLLIFVELPPLEFTTTPFPNFPASFEGGGLTMQLMLHIGMMA